MEEIAPASHPFGGIIGHSVECPRLERTFPYNQYTPPHRRQCGEMSAVPFLVASDFGLPIAQGCPPLRAVCGL